MERDGRKAICVWLEECDLKALGMITDYLEQGLFFPHWKSSSVAVRFALRRTVATLATELQAAKKRRRMLRRRNKKNQLKKG